MASKIYTAEEMCEMADKINDDFSLYATEYHGEKDNRELPVLEYYLKYDEGDKISDMLHQAADLLKRAEKVIGELEEAKSQRASIYEGGDGDYDLRLCIAEINYILHGTMGKEKK